jgi:hypothetical protein
MLLRAEADVLSCPLRHGMIDSDRSLVWVLGAGSGSKVNQDWVLASRWLNAN